MPPRCRKGWLQWITLTIVLAFFLTSGLPMAQSQNPDPQHIESNDPRVARAGNWTSQSVTQASGGSYMYSSGAETDVLTLQFSGPSIEVIFVAGPSLGTLAINVDDIVLRTVITTADQTAYQQSSRIDYLSDEVHTLKVYAQEGGIVAVDAFVIPTPSPSPLIGEGEADGETRDPFCAPINQIHRVSLTSTGGQGNGWYPTLSSDGRYVSFMSSAQLVPADTDTLTDVYVYDRQTCTTELISVGIDGGSANAACFDAMMSGDGRRVVFYSSATNLVPDDPFSPDIFVRDRMTATTIRVSAPTDGSQPNGPAWYFPTISGDGRFAGFRSSAYNLVPNDTNNAIDVFTYEIDTHTITRISVGTGGTEANSDSGYSSLSYDGQFVTFTSGATNLVVNDTNGLADTFVYDGQTNTTTRVSVGTGGTEAVGGSSIFPDISDDGRYVAFDSTATNLVVGDTNGLRDVFVYDRNTNTTTRVSVASDGTQGNEFSGLYAISANGRYVGFYSNATNFVSNDTNGSTDAFIHDRNTGLTSRVPANVAQGSNSTSAGVRFSDNPQYIAFESTADDLVLGDTNGDYDVFVAPLNLGFAPSNLTATALNDARIQLNWTDNASDETEFIVERSPDGVGNWLEIGRATANSTSYVNISLYCGTVYYYRVRAALTGGGFSTYSNVANATTSPCSATCSYTGNTWLVSRNGVGNTGNGLSTYPDMSGDGRYVVFTSTATDLIPNDATNGFSDIFVRDMQTCQIWQVNVSSSGTQGNGQAEFPKISANGRYIAFRSDASNLVAGASGNFIIYEHDRLTGQTILISVSNTGVAANGMSFLGDVANNGRVVFNTYATNFDPNDTDTYTDTYVRDPQVGTTILVDVSDMGVKANVGSAYDKITPDGRYVLFLSSATNLVPNDPNLAIDIYIRDLQTNTTSVVPLPSPIQGYFPLQYVALSDDARFIAFHTLAHYLSQDTNGFYDVYLYDRVTATLTLPGIPAIGLQSTGDTMDPVLSGNGRYLILNTVGNNWYHYDFNNAGDVMVVDLQTNLTMRVSETPYGLMADGHSWGVAMSTDGSQLVMASSATNFVPSGQDLNNQNDVFVKTLPHQPSLALFRSNYNAASQLNTLTDMPPISAYNSFTLIPPPGGYNGQWVMGDWDGDGLRTPGVYANNGVFYITNQSGGPGSAWLGTWIGLYGRPPVVGRFANVSHDCIGVVNSANMPPYGTAFALYYECSLVSGAPPLSWQWLSVILPDPTFSGTHQFVAGDFNGDGLDSIAIRRGEYIAFTNVAPSAGHAVYDLAQYWGVPPNTAGDEGVIVSGDWNLDNQDSFGVYYQSGYFYRRDDMQWNTGIHILQRVGQPIGFPVSATSWRPQ